VEPEERGDPMSPLRWTTKSLRHLANELSRQGHPVSAPTVGKLLQANGFSLQANAKSLEGAQHPDRDAQFRYLNEQVKEHQAAGEPVISVDTKKKEQLGALPNAGREWHPKGQPIQVEDHSFFTDPKAPQAIPYGVYGLTTDAGWVNVGVDHDTSAFAVASIRRWWRSRGQADYPQATRLLITAVLAVPTATATGRGRPNWPAWPPRRAWPSPSATSRRAPPSGIRSSIGCSATSR
jgi:Rhodopirellula transposase DDE domain